MTKSSGFTLIELIIVIVILSVLAAISAPLLISGANSYVTSLNTINATWQGQLALERMVRDIRAIRSPSDITTASGTQLVFVDTSGTTNTYTISSGAITLNGNILADGIGSLAFTYYDRNGTAGAATANIRYIKIAVNVTQGGGNYTLTTTAYPRNLF